MKKIIKLLLLLMLPCAAVAKEVKVVTIFVGDTNDKKIGTDVGVDVRNFKTFVSDLATAVKPESVITTMDIMTGRNCSKRNLIKYIDNLSCEGDIIFFLYSGHGGRSVKDSSKFPMMCLASNKLDEWMYISELNDRLRAKRPRLMVVMTNCCNSYYDVPRKRGESAQGTVNLGKGEGLRELFLNYKGEICMTAATAGELGWINDHDGGYLSYNMFKVFCEYDAKGDSANWHDFTKQLSDKTFEYSLSQYKKRLITNTQRPVYDVKVSKSRFDNSDNKGSDSDSRKRDDIKDTKDTKDRKYTDNDDKKDRDGRDRTEYINDEDSDDYSDNVDDDLYEDDENSMGATKSFFNSLWIALFGILLFKAPRFIGLEDITSTLVRIVGGAVLAWSIISFIMHL